MKTIQSYQEFWPYYVGEHQNRLCRALHYVGTTGAILNLASFLATLNPWFLLSGTVCGYAFAWVGHFFVEHNRPATFTYPGWSLISDFRMYFLALTGRMHKEVETLKGQGFKYQAPAATAQA